MKTFMKMNLPNKLTTLRMVAVIILIFIALIPWNGLATGGTFMQNWMYSCYANKDLVWVRIVLCVIFIVASFTDFLDGNIARKNNIVTTYGKFMDPIADKLLVNSLFIILTCWGLVPLGVLLIVICRDIVVDAIRMVMMEKNVVVAANIFGKLKTVVQMIAIPFVLIYPLIFPEFSKVFPLEVFLCYAAAIASLLSGVIYFIQAKDVVLDGALEGAKK